MIVVRLIGNKRRGSLFGFGCLGLGYRLLHILVRFLFDDDGLVSVGLVVGIDRGQAAV